MVTIATSLSPALASREIQKSALESWREAGFRSVSLNFPEEIESLKKNFGSWTEFRPAKRSSKFANNRKLVPVVDLLEASFEAGEGPAFVLNADIHLSKDSSQLSRSSPDAVVLLPRWEVNSVSSVEAEKNPWGWDGVLVGRNLRGRFSNPSFGLGLPWWDYWIPFRALYLKADLFEPIEMFAKHVRHPEKWSERDREVLTPEMWREVGVGPLRRFWMKNLGPKAMRKHYGYHNHLAGLIREKVATAKKPF